MRKNAAGSPPGTLGSLTLCPRINSRDLPQIKFRSSAGNGLLQRAFARTSGTAGGGARQHPLGIARVGERSAAPRGFAKRGARHHATGCAKRIAETGGKQHLR